MLIFHHTYLYFKVFQRTHFCRFLVILLKVKRPSFLSQTFADQAVWRSTESEVDRPGGRPIGQGPVFGRPASRPLFPTVENLIVGGRPIAVFPAELDPNDYIFEAYKLGLFWAVFDKI